MEYYYNEDGSKFAVLISKGYGAGWSTNGWNDYEELAYDKRVVEFYFENEPYKHDISVTDSTRNCAAVRYFEELGYENVYFGGFYGLKVKWVPVGKRFNIEEYDGNEKLVVEE